MSERTLSNTEQNSYGFETYRVLVSTDLGGDPDDTQSLIHLLHYSDVLKIEGIISTTGPGSTPRAENIRYWVRRTDLDYLRQRGHTELMGEAEVLSVVKQGAITARVPDTDGETEGSRWIIQYANAPDPKGKNRPLWVLAWGSLTDVAQALHDDPSIANKIRIYYIGSFFHLLILLRVLYLFIQLHESRPFAVIYPHWVKAG